MKAALFLAFSSLSVMTGMLLKICCLEVACFIFYDFFYFIANAIQCYHCPHTSMQGIQDCSAVDGKLLECRGLYDSCYFAKGKICKLT